MYWRAISEADLSKCLEIQPACLGDQIVGRNTALRVWKALLDNPAPRTIPSGEQLRTLRAIHVLEQIGSPEAVRLLQELAGGTPSARETLDAMAAGERLAHRVARP